NLGAGHEYDDGSYLGFSKLRSTTSMSLQDDIASARAKVHLRFPWWLRPFLMRGVVAITLGRRIFVAADIAKEHLEPLLRHELVHVEQIARPGLPLFYLRYFNE